MTALPPHGYSEYEHNVIKFSGPRNPLFIENLCILHRSIEFLHFSALDGGCHCGRKLRFEKVTFSWKDPWHLRVWAGAPALRCCLPPAVPPCHPRICL